MRVPFEDEDTQQGDGGPPLRVPESEQLNKKPITVLTQESQTENTPKNQSIALSEQPTDTFQNTTGPAAKKRRRKKAKEIRKKQQKEKTTLQTIAHVAYHSNAFNLDTQQIAQYFELLKCSKGHLTDMTYPNTGQRSNTPTMKIHHQHLMPQTQNGSKESSEHYYSMAGQSTRRFYPPSDQLQPNNQTQPKIPCKPSPNY